MNNVTQFPQPTGIRNIVAGEVRAWMARRGVSQVVLAAGVDISQSQISKRLNGKIPFDVDELDRIARFLGTDVVTLVSGANSPRARRDSNPQPSDPKVLGYAIPLPAA